jgi:hypothetical protein
MALTLYFIYFIIAAVAIFDVWVILAKSKQESISAYIIRGSRKYPLVTLIVGVVLGHLYWPMRTDDIYYNAKCFIEKDGKLVELEK